MSAKNSKRVERLTYGIATVKDLLQLPKQSVFDAVDRGDLPVVNHRGALIFLRSDVEAFQAKREASHV